MSAQFDSDTELLLQKITESVISYIKQVHTHDRKVIQFTQPETMKDHFDFSIHQHPTSRDDILALIPQIMNLSVATQHPRFFNALWAGSDIYGIVGERLTTILGTTMYTYEIAPLFTIMEQYIFDKIAHRVGRESNYDGIFQPGGTSSNMMGIHLARYTLQPDIHETGMYGLKPHVIFTSDESHYSITKSAMLLGIGKQHVIKIDTNPQGEMDIQDLEKKILTATQSGLQPLMINATCGTTVLGAFDDLQSISDIAKKYKIWLHADAARGGSVLFSDALQHKLTGIDRVDSFTRNPHKMFGAPLQCSIMMTKHADSLSTCNILHSQYLFNEDKAYDGTYDTGDKYIQCGRRVDVLKLRLQWKASGDSGIAKRIDGAFEKTKYLSQKIQQSQKLFLLQEPDCTNVNFWYLPAGLQKKSISMEIIKENYEIIHGLTAKIQALMIQKGEMMCMCTNTKGFPNFFRMIVISPAVTTQDLDFVVEHIETLGDEIESKIS